MGLTGAGWPSAMHFWRVAIHRRGSSRISALSTLRGGKQPFEALKRGTNLCWSDGRCAKSRIPLKNSRRGKRRQHQNQEDGRQPSPYGVPTSLCGYPTSSWKPLFGTDSRSTKNIRASLPSPSTSLSTRMAK